MLASGNLGDQEAALSSPHSSANGSRLDLTSPQLRDTHSVPQAMAINSGGERMSRKTLLGNMVDNSEKRHGDMDDELGSASDVGDDRWHWGYSILRFKASNPGIWPFHCHTALHAASGMAMLFEVSRCCCLTL